MPRRLTPARPCGASLCSALALLALTAGGAHAQNETVLTTAVPFLQIEPDSRAAGMGMANVAIAEGANAQFWNPAGLASQEGVQVALTYAPWLPELGADLSFNYAAASYNLPGVGTFAGHITYLNLGTQQYTDANGGDLGEFSSGDWAFGVSYGREVGGGLSVGVGGRYIYSNITGGVEVEEEQTTAGTAIAGDLGLLYRAPEIGNVQPVLGVNLANAGSSIRYGAEDDDFGLNALPTTLRFGGAATSQLDEFNRITVALDLTKVLVGQDSAGADPDPFYEALFSSWGTRRVDVDGSGPGEAQELSALSQLTLGTGLEYWYNDLFALRTGYFYEDPNNGGRQFLTFGAGFRYSLLGVDLSYIYATGEDSPLDQQIRFSLAFNVVR